MRRCVSAMRMRAVVPVPVLSARRLCTATPTQTYPHTVELQTRWGDNDIFGHVNNVVFYAFMDDAVNNYLIAHGVTQRRFVAQSNCRYVRPLAYPQPVEVGLGIAALGRSSVTYSMGIFSRPAPSVLTGTATSEQREFCAEGTFVHVFVDDETGRPTPMSEHTRAALSSLVFDAAPS